MTELQPIIVSNGRHFVRHLGICNTICVKLLEIMSGVIPRNFKKTTSVSQTVFLRSTNAAHTHTHTHTHKQTHTHTNTLTHRMDGGTDGRTDGWPYGRTDVRTDGRKDGRT